MGNSWGGSARDHRQDQIRGKSHGVELTCNTTEIVRATHLLVRKEINSRVADDASGPGPWLFGVFCNGRGTDALDFRGDSSARYRASSCTARCLCSEHGSCSEMKTRRFLRSTRSITEKIALGTSFGRATRRPSSNAALGPSTLGFRHGPKPIRFVTPRGAPEHNRPMSIHVTPRACIAGHVEYVPLPWGSPSSRRH